MTHMQSDREMFARLYDESYKMVYNYLYARTFDQSLAEEVSAEAYMRAWNKFSTFDPQRAKFSTWVIFIARNLLTSHYRAMRDVVPVDSVSEQAFSVVDKDDYADREQVEQLLALLTEEERELVYLRYWLEMSPAQIAEATDANASTVRTRLHRAMEKMRRQV